MEDQPARALLLWWRTDLNHRFDRWVIGPAAGPAAGKQTPPASPRCWWRLEVCGIFGSGARNPVNASGATY
jgi:hypothetical protein